MSRTIGERLAECRKRAGLTQEQVAERTGLSRPHIQKLESGGSSPTLATLEAILKACDMTLSEFFGGDVPEHFRQDPADVELHELLQDLLRSAQDDLRVTTVTTLKALHSAMLKEAAAEAPKRKSRKKERH